MKERAIVDRRRCEETYSVPLVACDAHDCREGGSIGEPSREFIEDVTQGPREDALDSGHLFENRSVLTGVGGPLLPQVMLITCTPCHLSRRDP